MRTSVTSFSGVGSVCLFNNWIKKINCGLLLLGAIAYGNNAFGQAGPGEQVSIGLGDERTVEFNRDIRPILADNCYACHGPDKNQRQAELRLDVPEVVGDGTDSEIIVAGKAGESELIRRIFSDDADEVMPPKDHRKKLSAEQKDLLRLWIEQGAHWEGHWAWLPVKSANPKIDSESVIDQRVRARLSERQIEPSPEADRRTLIRRLYFDVVGLPPSPTQVASFVADKSPNAYEKVVDELLASPHFGERMAAYWLDLVRYADTVGYHGDQDVSVSPYRDYVINAFNDNKPFDEFTREQLAGDLLPSPTLWQQVASGYNRLGMMSAEGGVQPDEYLTKYAADRVRTTASVWLGITLGCCECHDHKFDPFTTKDFYSFGAFFADIKERGLYDGANSTGDWGPSVSVADDELAGLLRPLDDHLSELRSKMTATTDGVAQEQAAWEKEIRSQLFDWKALKPESFAAVNQTTFAIQEDQSILLSGDASNEDCYVIGVTLPAGKYQALRLEGLAHDSLPKKGPGRADNANFVVTELLVVRDSSAPNLDSLKKVHDLWDKESQAKLVRLTSATATIEQADNSENNPYKKWPAEAAIDHDQHGPTWGWAILPETGQDNELVVRFVEPIEVAESDKLQIVIQQYHGQGNHVLGRFRLSISTDPAARANPIRSLPAEIREILSLPAAERTVEQTTIVSNYFISIAPRFEPTREQIVNLEKERADLVAQHTRTTLVTVAVEPRPMRVLPRGNWMDHSGEVVEPRIPALFANEVATDSRRLTRLDLANWIVDPQNPMTSRVFVNRVWKMYFGTGFSKVLDDVGSQGEWPSHPQLLDRLASDFVGSGYDIKKLVRQILMSQTYRQSSIPRPELASIDPYNRLLARQASFRIEAEMIRDNALSVSGLLVPKIGGRSVKPYQPAGLYQHLNFPAREYVADHGESQFRRGLYTHWQRQFLHPAMKTFDAPSREECTCDRPRSNTPTGALVMLNDPSLVEAARALAQSCCDGDAAVDAVINAMFQHAVSRTPGQEELTILSELYASHLRHYEESPDEALALVSIGISPRNEQISVERLAAWTSVARVIMNLHEFVTRY